MASRHTSEKHLLGPFAERALRARLANARVFLAKLDATLEDTPEGQRTAKQLTKLLEMIDGIVERPKPADSRPSYSRMDLVLPIKRVAENFQDCGRARLGLPAAADLDKELWTRVKALSRRLTLGQEGYDRLQPVSDLKQQLQERLFVMLQNPVAWDGREPSDDDKQQIYAAIAGELSRRLLEAVGATLR